MKTETTTKEKELLFKIDVKTLLDITKTLKEFLTEVRFNLNNEGLKITELEIAHICLIDITINKHKFIHITEQEELKTYGINVNSLYDVLKENKKENVEITTQDNKLYLKFDNGINSEMFLIDIEEKKEDIPELEFKTEITLQSKRLKEILKHFCSVSESVVFNSLSDGFKIYSDTGLNKSEIKLNLDEVKINSEEEVKSKYSIEYLSKLIKVIFSDKTILKFSEDSPLKFEQETEDLKVIYILAPRVETED